VRGLAHPVKKRRNANPIADQQQPLTTLVPQRDRELAIEMLDEAVTILFVQVNDDLGVRVGPKAMPLALQHLPQLQIVVDLAIEDNSHTAIFIEDGLPAALQIDDAQPRVCQRKRRALQKPFTIGASMPQCRSHGRNLPGRRGKSSVSRPAPI